MAIPHVILFDGANCTGKHTHVCETLSFIGDYFNDLTSSFIILEGVWLFYSEGNFVNLMGGKVLEPGVYNWIEDALGSQTNDKLSSLKHL
jgi:Beta/Gamma crystallin